ncbi:hypothetical protein [Streptomyces sp. SR-10]|uniref:hypothetical protein n=1 Tax=Streptomyces sp. SR-10 TaxID=3416442 RepID=UPI003CF21A01
MLVVAAAVVATVRLWPTELRTLREQNLCLGMLTERTAGLLQDGRGGAVRVDESGPDGSGSGAKASDPVFSTVCFVNRENADDKSGMRLQLKGWVGQQQSEVQAPDGCAKEMGRPEAQYVTVALKVSPVAIVGRDRDYASLKKDVRTVILEAVENLAKQYDCAA